MTIQFNDETFRDDYSFYNSDWAINAFRSPSTKTAICTPLTWSNIVAGRKGRFMKCVSMWMSITYRK